MTSLVKLNAEGLIALKASSDPDGDIGAEKLRLSVRTLDGKEKAFSVHPATTGGELSQSIFQLTTIRPESQAGRVLTAS